MNVKNIIAILTFTLCCIASPMIHMIRSDANYKIIHDEPYSINSSDDIKIRYHLLQSDGNFKDIYFKENMSYKIGESVSFPVPADYDVSEGYKFAGWYKDIELTCAVIDNSIFSIDNVKTEDNHPVDSVYYIDVYGNIVPCSGIITLNPTGGKIKILSMPYTSISHELPIPVKAGAQFAGWFEDSGVNAAITDKTFINGGNITLYAKWNDLKPAEPNIKIVNKKKKTIGLKVSKTNSVDGIIVQIAKTKKFKKNGIQENKFEKDIDKATIKILKKGFRFVRICTYRIDKITGNPVYSDWSNIVKIN